jgi:hypothetical protein
MHTLLGVGGSTAALTAAGDGLLTKIVGAAAKFVLQATKERPRCNLTTERNGGEGGGGTQEWGEGREKEKKRKGEEGERNRKKEN